MKKKKSALLVFTWLLFAAIIVAAIGIAVFVIIDVTQQEELFPVASATPAPTATPYVFSGELTQLIWFYKPPDNGDLATVAENFDAFILTHKDESERDELESLGVTVPILQYLRFDGIMDPGSCDTTPWGNQVAYKKGEFCQISEEHPDWFLLDQNGERIYDSEGFAFMDPGNQEWRQFFLNRAIYFQENLGWEGVFLDNVEASLDKHEGKTLQQYPTLASYQDAVEGFLAYLSQSHFQPQGIPLYANIIELNEHDVWFRYLNYLDGAMVEAWAVGWRNDYRWPDRWNEHLDLAERTQALGKEIILISQGYPEKTNRQRFAFASYLLISEGNAYFRYSLADNHQQIWLYPNYELDLGVPLGPRYQDGNEWKRDFSNGTVSLNPAKHTATINLDD